MPGSVLREHLLFFRETQCVRMMVAGAGVGRCGRGSHQGRVSGRCIAVTRILVSGLAALLSPPGFFALETMPHLFYGILVVMVNVLSVLQSRILCMRSFMREKGACPFPWHSPSAPPFLTSSALDNLLLFRILCF